MKNVFRNRVPMNPTTPLGNLSIPCIIFPDLYWPSICADCPLTQHKPRSSKLVKMVETETIVDPQPSKEEEAANGNEEQMPDVQKPSDDSDSDSDSDSEDETQAKAQTEALELELYNNPSNYDAYVQVNTDNAHIFTYTLVLLVHDW